jgi:hypothetical protein
MKSLFPLSVFWMYGFFSRTLLGHHVVHVVATECPIMVGQVTHTTFTVGMSFWDTRFYRRRRRILE